MPQIYSAFASEVKVNQETIEGLQAIEYVSLRDVKDIGAIGTDERVGVYFGRKVVTGTLRVASANKTLDDLHQNATEFSISATLKHRDTIRKVTFDACYVEDRSFRMAVQGHGETVYSFSSTRVREE